MGDGIVTRAAVVILAAVLLESILSDFLKAGLGSVTLLNSLSGNSDKCKTPPPPHTHTSQAPGCCTHLLQPWNVGGFFLLSLYFVQVVLFGWVTFVDSADALILSALMTNITSRVILTQTDNYMQITTGHRGRISSAQSFTCRTS